jgi:hypothetical protein
MSVEKIISGDRTHEFEIDPKELRKRVHLNGLIRLIEMKKKEANVEHRYKSLFEGASREQKELVEPQKTLIGSLVALETFSGLKIEHLHREGLLVPVVLMFKSVGCEWDDCMDGENNTNQKEKERKALELWNRGINLLGANRNIAPERKEELCNDLDSAKKQYQYYEMEFKNENNFVGLDPLCKFTIALKIREQSFGNMAKVMTRVFTKGIENKKLENQMACATIAFGIIDGADDIDEDTRDETMTEARALHEHTNGNKYLFQYECYKAITTLLDV